MPGRVLVGHERTEQEVRLLYAADPDLLPVEDEVIAVADRAALERGEVGTGVRLGEVLERDLLRAEQRLEELLLLRLVGPDEKRREDQAIGEAGNDSHSPELLLDYGLVLTGETASAVLLGVGRIEPALVGQDHVHVPPERVLPVSELVPVNGGSHVVGNILFQPRPDFPTELFLIFRVLIGEIHPLSSGRKLVRFWTFSKQ